MPYWLCRRASNTLGSDVGHITQLSERRCSGHENEIWINQVWLWRDGFGFTPRVYFKPLCATASMGASFAATLVSQKIAHGDCFACLSPLCHILRKRTHCNVHTPGFISLIIPGRLVLWIQTTIQTIRLQSAPRSVHGGTPPVVAPLLDDGALWGSPDDRSTRSCHSITSRATRCSHLDSISRSISRHIWRTQCTCSVSRRR